MTTKNKLLGLFEENKGIYFSGEEIAKKLCVSRAAVWKAVKSLRDEGYDIDAVTNKGYCLSVNTDILSVQGIQKYLKQEYKNMDINVILVIGSTNDLVREKANEGYDEGYIAIANEQTKGRGRYGRKFFSPSGTGLYMSILLRPKNYSASEAVKVTMIAAVALCEAIEEVSDEKAEIKWVNDVFINGKKICGILTEASYGLESGVLDYAVVGVGINVYRPEGGFTEEIEQIAGAIFDTTRDDLKNHLSASFINNFMRYYLLQKDEFVEEYRRRSFVVGKKVMVIMGDNKREALVKGVDKDCRLIVKYDDGEEECLSYGEISIKVNN